MCCNVVKVDQSLDEIVEVVAHVDVSQIGYGVVLV
jgi:hypothetical protein